MGSFVGVGVGGGDGGGGNRHLRPWSHGRVIEVVFFMGQSEFMV